MIASAFPWTPPSPASLGVFLVIIAFIIVFYIGGFVWVTERDHRVRSGLYASGLLAVWMGWHSFITLHLETFMPASLFINLASINLCVLILVFSPAGKKLSTLPLAALVALPVYRFPLELVLHAWAEQGVIPWSMTYEGQNIDIAAGVIAPLGAGLMLALPSRARSIAWVSNTLCFLLLLNVLRVAILSGPGPFRVFGDPPLVLFLYVPTTYIVCIAVAGAMAGHLLTFRALMRADPPAPM